MIDMIGKQFGRWTVTCIDEFSSKKALKYICKCECGKIKSIAGAELRRGRSKSCGCLQLESVSKHNMSYSRLYGIWGGMKDRCYNKNEKHYKEYGFRGISVCKEWKEDFNSFYEWAMSNGYSEKLTIDRIDVNGDYEPNNCRWITKEEQNRNKRDTVLMECDGKVHCQKEWSRLLGVSYEKFRYAMKKGNEICGKRFIRV